MSYDLSDISHGYPFLHLNRKINVPYSQMLEIVDWMDAWRPAALGIPTASMVQHRFDIPFEKYTAIKNVCCASWRWQFPPQGRGL